MARNKYPDQTVEKILDVAFGLFCSKGYDNTSISDIVAGLDGLTKGAIYHHFDSKEAILDAAFERAMAPIAQARRAVCEDRGYIENRRWLAPFYFHFCFLQERGRKSLSSIHTDGILL